MSILTASAVRIEADGVTSMCATDGFRGLDGDVADEADR